MHNANSQTDDATVPNGQSHGTNGVSYAPPPPHGQQPPQSPAPRRPARSKNGCMTCSANTTGNANKGQSPTAIIHPIFQAAPVNSNTSPGDVVSTPGDQQWLQNPGAVDQLFDYASFMWDVSGGDGFTTFSPERAQTNFGSTGSDPWIDPWQSIVNPSQPTNTNASTSSGGPKNKDLGLVRHSSNLDNASPTRPGMHHGPSQVAEDRHLIDYFIRTVVPPILAEVETQKRWATMRQILISMSNNSAMVRCSILAFSSLLYFRQTSPRQGHPQHHYETAMRDLMASDPSFHEGYSSAREHLLATLFFLIYVDILEDRMQMAHDNLKRAYDIFRNGKKRSFRPIELRLLSWIRLLDARAVSAGGEGLFLSDNNEALIVQPSPVRVEEDDHEGGATGLSCGAETDEGAPESDIEDVLFQVLYHPGIVFFQKVQSFMGRISKIDPWHRSRGTVEDETEVMNIALNIMKDLRKLYDDRPALMDHAVAGGLTPPHVSANLAFAITRAFRTYLSNYHASKIHLHRVAYKNLPLTRETADALSQIRHLTRLMVEGLSSEDALPVSQLWPLLMLGSEEDDLSERQWIKDQILRMEKVATNARITAQVLEEVQARQDVSKARVDIRSVMHATFDSCFAIM
ncbi:uncharacterized protein E0L32_001099 [Thyridium curvatum]|uniref:Uncharacterized protein n=1 Tax=Thyridium curvatum TaxID=1093900 RepID=A0A507B2H9_9PEZI|nr:uncharacterized protein E0L32_001099 [Thyridium curvatum]TPX11281.1 hypothetical protein E0L32_001099 [Thyridium curvatum]